MQIAYGISQCSDATEHACSLIRAFTALAHAQKWAYIWHIFQSMLRLEVACMQSCHSLHWSRTCRKWAYIWHILSDNAQTRLRMRAVWPEPFLLSHMHKIGVHMAYFISKCSDAPEHTCSLTRAFTALAHAHEWAKTWHILSANAQTRSSMHAVL